MAREGQGYPCYQHDMMMKMMMMIYDMALYICRLFSVPIKVYAKLRWQHRLAVTAICTAGSHWPKVARFQGQVVSRSIGQIRELKKQRVQVFVSAPIRINRSCIDIDRSIRPASTRARFFEPFIDLKIMVTINVRN